MKIVPPIPAIRKPARTGLKILAWALAVLVLAWLAGWIYVELNEQQLIDRITAKVEEKKGGKLKIEGLSVSFFRTFPILSLQLSGVSYRDTLFDIHHREVLNAKDIYLKLGIGGLITGNSPLGKVIIRDGTINLLTDSVGNTNEYLLKSDGDSAKAKNKVDIPDIVFQNVTVNYENLLKFKKHNFVIRNFKCQTTEKSDLLIFDINLHTLVNSLSFNTKRGSYLNQKMLEGKFNLVFDRKAQRIIIDNVKLNLENHPFYFNGFFSTDKLSADFKLNISTKDVDFSKAASLVNENIRKKLEEYSFTKPVSFSVELSGKTQFRVIPLVRAAMTVRNNKVLTPKGLFEDCNFDATFSNETVFGKPRLDENSDITIKNFTGRWENIPLRSKSIMISNLIFPFLACDIASEVNMKTFNKLAGSSTFNFLDGDASINVIFKTPLIAKDTTASSLDGEITFKNASIKYVPRNFVLDKCSGNLKFTNSDLVVNKITASSGKTQLTMSGSARNFLSMLNVSPEKLVLNWKISSPKLYLEDFKGFLSKAEIKNSDKKEVTFGSAGSKVDKMFADGDMYISLDVPAIEYKTFKATNMKANVILKQTEIALEKVQLNHANGSMEITGSMKNGINSNPVTLNTVMKNMDIPLLFSAFSDFGQDAITSKNLKGKLSAQIIFNTSINNEAKLLSSQNDGSITFSLEDGELNNFQPLIAVSEKAFKKQDFSQIRFATLENKLDVKGSTFIVNPMDIRSTALNLSVEGVFDMKKGTDMSIRLPLKNLTRSQANTDISDEAKTKKGVGLRLRAKTGDDGKLKVSWDPFRRALKNKEVITDSTQAKN